MGWFSDFRDGVSDAVSGIISIPKEVFSQLDDAAKDILGAADEIFGAFWNDFIMELDDMFADILTGLYNLPKELAKSLMQMFKDPNFWIGVMLFLGLVMGAQGLTAMKSAAPGMKMKAFMTGAGNIYHGWHVDFAVKLHRLAHLVSPEYRESFQNMLGDLPDRMVDAGIDIGNATNIFMTTMALSDSFGAMLGKDWNASQNDIVQNIGKMGNVTSERLQEWGQDPSKMIAWIDENMIAPAHNEASKFMNKLSNGLNTVNEGLDKAAKNIASFRGNLLKTARALDKAYGTEYEEKIKSELVTIDDILFVQWEELHNQINNVSDILSVKVAAANTGVNNNWGMFKAVNDYPLSVRKRVLPKIILDNRKGLS